MPHHTCHETAPRCKVLHIRVVHLFARFFTSLKLEGVVSCCDCALVNILCIFQNSNNQSNVGIFCYIVSIRLSVDIVAENIRPGTASRAFSNNCLGLSKLSSWFCHFKVYRTLMAACSRLAWLSQTSRCQAHRQAIVGYHQGRNLHMEQSVVIHYNPS